MGIGITTTLVTFINIAILIAIIIGIVKGIKGFMNLVNRSKQMDKKLDVILGELEKRNIN